MIRSDTIGVIRSSSGIADRHESGKTYEPFPRPKSAIFFGKFLKMHENHFLIRFRSFERHFIFFTLKNILGLVKFFCRISDNDSDTIGSIWNHSYHFVSLSGRNRIIAGNLPAKMKIGQLASPRRPILDVKLWFQPFQRAQMYFISSNLFSAP